MKLGLAEDNVELVSLNRADLHRILEENATDTKVKFDTTVTELTQNDSQVDVTFSDGTSDTFDLVVGSDGINSQIRTYLFPHYAPKKTGAAIWTFMLPDTYHLADKHTVHQVWGDQKFMGIFPIKDGAAVTFGMPFLPSRRPSRIDIRKTFSGLSPEANDILSHIDPTTVYSSHLREIKLKKWYKGSVVLAGDAAHAMVPATGMGASIGLQDARALAKLIIESPELTTVPRAYQRIRKPRAAGTQREAFFFGNMMLAGALLSGVRDILLPIIPTIVVAKRFKAPIRV